MGLAFQSDFFFVPIRHVLSGRFYFCFVSVLSLFCKKDIRLSENGKKSSVFKNRSLFLPEASRWSDME